jgi:hypothetical protein
LLVLFFVSFLSIDADAFFCVTPSRVLSYCVSQTLLLKSSLFFFSLSSFFSFRFSLFFMITLLYPQEISHGRTKGQYGISENLRLLAAA